MALKGPGLLRGLDGSLENPGSRDALLGAIRRVESEPTITGLKRTSDGDRSGALTV